MCCDVHEVSFRPILVCVQAQQKHRRLNTLLQNAYTHLEKTGSFVRIFFIDFSYAINTTQPHLMASKLLKLDVNPRLILWIVGFLVNRSQTVRHQALVFPLYFHRLLPPILFTLYTNDCTDTDTKS